MVSDLAASLVRIHINDPELPTLDTDIIRNCVQKACDQPLFAEFPPSEADKLTHELEARFQTVIGEERELVGDDEGWEEWLPQRRGKIPWNFWQRYEEYLKHEGFGDRVRSRLDRSTDSVLGFIGNPERDGAWDRRGLVVGLVQSGKTAHYIGLINKATDAGYKVIVILTGVSENLRRQTQVRVEEGILGYHYEPDRTDRKRLNAKSCGVELITPLKPRPNSVTTRKGDFNKGVANHLGIHIYPGCNSSVFVVKKNASILKNLLSYLVDFASSPDSEGRRYVKDVPLLVVDDESDICSIDTKKGALDVSGDPDDDHDPTKINKQIRKLLSLFDKNSYVGYTATPFANVLIHDLLNAGTDPEDKLLIGEDLFPRSFIVSLPTPSSHVGPTLIFGTEKDDGSGQDALPILREITDTEIGETPDDYWIPASHRKAHVPRYRGEDTVPDSLREAIRSFLLGCCARRLRGDGDKHSSMLVHVTRFVDVQDRIYEQVCEEVQGIRSRLRNRTADAALRDELRTLWETDFRVTTEALRGLDIEHPDTTMFQNPAHSWEEIEAELRNAAEAIEVRTIHGKSGEDLDYDKHPKGLCVIAIGGDKLSRGLTLDGLSVSYFLRCSKMYDTLMQMGRWFGYRPGYLDLCRLYATDDLQEWFKHIAGATEELREEFDHMAILRRSPKDFGLKVCSHPLLMVTSAVKMRHGTTLRVSFEGSLVQTIDFSRKKSVIDRHWKAGETLAQACEKDGAPLEPPKDNKNKHAWRDVPADAVLAFLHDYKEHPRALRVNTGRIRDYISKENASGRLVRWCVLVSGGAGQECDLGNARKIKRVIRKWGISGKEDSPEYLARWKEFMDNDHFRTGISSSPVDEQTGLGKEQIDRALDETLEGWRKNPKRSENQPTRPGGLSLRYERSEEEGLLILYPLENRDDKKAEKGVDNPTLSFVISFPSVASGASTVDYIVNNIYDQDEAAHEADEDGVLA